ncbi:MAG: hypothetical protein JSR21_02845 [Proteobacteria bacterium]|nr:hypothetical protein [Pseudomonadota bacterium]
MGLRTGHLAILPADGAGSSIGTVIRVEAQTALRPGDAVDIAFLSPLSFDAEGRKVRPPRSAA